jgi:hypothetical protein
VSLDDNGRTIGLRLGERLLVALGDDLEWAVDVDDPAVVSRVPNITPVGGSQGVYQADRVGRTRLRATGDPACRKAQPPCAQPSRTFQVQITVQ